MARQDRRPHCGEICQAGQVFSRPEMAQNMGEGSTGQGPPLLPVSLGRPPGPGVLGCRPRPVTTGGEGVQEGVKLESVRPEKEQAALAAKRERLEQLDIRAAVTVYKKP
jgi:hypothetical protein